MPDTKKTSSSEKNQSLLRSAIVGAACIVLSGLVLLTPQNAASMGYFVQSHDIIDPVT